MKTQSNQEHSMICQGIAEEFIKFYSEKAQIQERQEWDDTQELFLQKSRNDYQGGK
ncbi:hypothetical protein HY837_00205 [archaeon]|nr:hypothetical protein [archaeon]